MYGKKIIIKSNVFLFLFFILFSSGALAQVNVTLVNPENGYIFINTTNITFNCTATGDAVYNITLYHNLTGTWEANQTQVFGEFVWDTDSLLLCHYNGDTECLANGSGAATNNASVGFEDAVFFQGATVNDTDILTYATANNFDKNQGTIEFWVRTTYAIDAGSQEDRWFFAIGGEYVGDSYEIYVASDHLVFKIKDVNENDHWIESNILNWQAGEWHHVAAVWDLDGDVGNGEKMELYIDGTADNSNYDTTGVNIYVENIASNMFIGSCDVGGCGSQYVADATFDELRISKTVKTQTEINESYQKGLEDRSWVSATWNVSGVGDGYYVWNCLAYDNDSESNWSLNNFSFSVDVSPPRFNDIYHTPNSTDDVDPGSEINVTVNLTDFSGVDTVILQWKETVWNNVTMVNIGGDLWRGGFSIDVTGGNYSYRIWANDTHSIANTSQTINITAEWDYTWNATPLDFGTVHGKINTIGNLGMLRVNNTGDDPLEFTLSHNWPLNVYFNGSANTLSFYLENKSEVDINITIQFSSLDSESSMVININASHGSETPEPVFRQATALINSYSGGPYLDVSLVSLPTTVYQSQTINLSAKVKNIGNETGNETWLNWSLPTGWSVLSGNLSYYIGNLSSGNVAWNNITVRLSPETASAGVFTVYANSSCNGSSDSESETVVVRCSNSDGVCGAGCTYTNDDDCTVPSGGTTTVKEEVRTGGGGVKEQRYGVSLSFPERIDIYRGKESVFTAIVSNTEEGSVIENCSLSVTGYPQIHITISPSSFRVEHGKPKSVEIRIFAPNYTSYGEHLLKIQVKGNGKTVDGEEGEEVEDTKNVLLVIHGVEENETLESIEKAENEINRLKEMGFDVSRLEEIVKEANKSFTKWDYDSAKRLAERILEEKEYLLKAHQVIKELENKIKKAENNGIELNETLVMYELARAAFSRGDYKRAEERGNDALLAYAIESATPNLRLFLYRYWFVIITIVLVVVFSSVFLKRKLYILWVRKQLEKLKIEEREIRKLMKNLQKQHFEEKSISKSEYYRMMYVYEKRLADIKKLKAKFSSKLIGAFGSKRVLKSLKEEEKRIKEIMEDAQLKYFHMQSISRSSYLETMRALREELLDIKMRIKEIVSSMGEKEKWKYRIKEAGLAVVFVFLLSSLFGAVCVKGDLIIGTENSSLQAIHQAENYIKEMVAMGFGVSYANDTLNEAKHQFKIGNYIGAETLARYVKDIKDSAIRVDKLIDRIEKRIYEAEAKGINVSSAKTLFSSGIEEFENERYVNAENLLNQAENKVEEAEAEFYMKMVMEKSEFDWAGFLKANLIVILLLGAGFFITVFVGYREMRIRRIKKSIIKLENEKKSLKLLMKEAQEAYFKYKTMGKSEYERAMEIYQLRLAKIKKEVPVLLKLLGDLKLKKF